MFQKIEIPNAAIRFLTLACYFLPFVFFFSTCVDGVSKSAYNKEEAIANEREKMEVEKKDLLDKAADLITDNVGVTDSSAEFTSETIKILQSSNADWYLQPTYTSLSAPGVAFTFKNAIGQIIVVISFLLSLITFVLWRFLKKKAGIYIIGLNLILMLVFAIICVIENVTMLYGAWALIFLLVVQLLTEVQSRRKINPTLGDINPN
jgi:hypothetical protein